MITIDGRNVVEVPRRYGPGTLLREVTPEVEAAAQRQVDYYERIARAEGKPFDRDETLEWVRVRQADRAARIPAGLLS